MQVDRLVILYRDVGSNDAESVGSADALAAKFSARLARLAQEKLSDDYRKKAGKLTRVHKVGFSSLAQKQGKQTANAAGKFLKKDFKGLGPLVAEERALAGRKLEGLTWGVYLILHGGGGRATHGIEPKEVAELLRQIGDKAHKEWQLKKVCIVGCTLGAPSLPPAKADAYAKQCCDALARPGTLVGGYTVPVYVAFPAQPQGGFPLLRQENQQGHKFIQPLRADGEDHFDCQDAVQRLSTDNRGRYKVAWRWDADRKESVAVDIEHEWHGKVPDPG